MLAAVSRAAVESDAALTHQVTRETVGRGFPVTSLRFLGGRKHGRQIPLSSNCMQVASGAGDLARKSRTMNAVAR